MEGSREKLISDYFKHVKVWKTDESYWDTWGYVNSLVVNDPAAAWPLILELLAAAPDRHALQWLGCGPLENLIMEHPGFVRELLLAELPNNKRLQFATAAVMLCDEDEMAKELDVIAAQYKLDEINPLDGTPRSSTNNRPG